MFDKNTYNTAFWRNLTLVLSGVAFYFVLLNLEYILGKVTWIFGLFRPFIWGFVFAFLLNGLMVFLEKKPLHNIKKRKKRRFWGVFFTFVITLGAVTILFAFLLPQLGASLKMLASKVPEYAQNLQEYLTLTFPFADDQLEGLLGKLGEFVTQWLPELYAYSTRVATLTLNIFVGLIVAVYLLFNKETYLRQTRKIAQALLPDIWVDRATKIIRYGNETFTGFFYSKLLDSLAVGVICFLGMVLMGLPYALLVSVIVGVTNVIPFFGPFIGAIPSALLILAVDPLQMVWFVIFILVLQQFDGNIMGPKIMSNSIGLPAIWVMFAILIGGGMFGFVGMILGIPVFAMFYNLAREYVNTHYLLEKQNN